MDNIKWLRDGTKVRVISDNPLIVIEQVTIDDGEYSYEDDGRTYPVDRVFDAAPVAVLSEEVAALNKKIDYLRGELSEAQLSLNDATRKREQIIAAYAKTDTALENIADVLQCNVTHFVSAEYGRYEILDIAELNNVMREKSDDYGYHVLGLYLRRKANGLKWELWGDLKKSGYSDYLHKSGVYPCTSYEQAVEKLGELLLAKVQEGVLSRTILAAADQYGIALPGDYEQRIVDGEAASIRKEIADHAKKIESLRLRLDELQN